jgi:hypothetical protein
VDDRLKDKKKGRARDRDGKTRGRKWVDDTGKERKKECGLDKDWVDERGREKTRACRRERGEREWERKSTREREREREKLY